MIDPEDYQEPACPLSRPESPPPPEPEARIPLGEVLRRSDELFQKEDAAGVGEHLRHWRQEAQRIGDRMSELTLLSELMGHYRMENDPERGVPAIEDGLALIRELGQQATVGGATVMLNAATALHAFGNPVRALRLYEEVARIYREHLDPKDWRFAGLFNNFAAAYQSTGEFENAERCLRHALAILDRTCPDRPVTWINLARLYYDNDPEDPRAAECADEARKCFNDPDVKRDSYYAHTCRKCAGGFGYLGFFLDEIELNRRADLIYGGN